MLFGRNTRTFRAQEHWKCIMNLVYKKGGGKMKKQLIPGTKIVKVIAGKDNGGEKLRKDLEKIGKIELLGKTVKSIFSI